MGGRTGEQACVASCGQADGPTVGKQQVTQLLLSRVGRDEGGACSSLGLALGFPLEAGGRWSGPVSGAPPFEFPRSVAIFNCSLIGQLYPIFLLHCCTLELVAPHVSLGDMHSDKIVLVCCSHCWGGTTARSDPSSN
ncbi:hypothetical protein IscW_ISCW011436 [Ixodes scapularis]|uniref:Uncharacterized protein n=1 Tax=Ixodes scapularis TaxID=6945 RepID=B7Q6Y5_IXOSC|nr:hypothetical protein IscW_ISCW011436 [Ixodes scapularis]|eukprot:XP_002412052.1 hypothetical protein IscW_ISCW011436 [Ixodes scapularis]